MKRITVITDASYDMDYLVGGYAFYIYSDMFKINKVGVFLNNPESSVKAEILGLENAMIVLKNLPEYKGNEQIVIMCDCVPAIHKVQNPDCNISRRANKVWRSLRSRRGTVTLRHIEGHSNKNHGNYKSQKWCDINARKAMRNRINQLKKELS